MKSRNISPWVIAAVTVLIATACSWTFMAHQKPIIDGDFKYDAGVISIDNFYDSKTKSFTGSILSKTNFSYDVLKETAEGIEVKNTFDVRKPSGERIFVVNRKYGIDPKSGAHVSTLGDKKRSGQLFASPNGRDSFEYWHINYDTSLTMKFIGEEELNGIMVDMFETDVHADQTSDLTYLPGVPDTRGIEIDGKLRLWIEPITRMLIKYEDEATAWYYNITTKRRIEPWNKFENKFEELSISNKITEAKIEIEERFWFKYYIPLMFLFAAAMVLLIGYKFRQPLLWRLYVTVGLVVVSGVLVSFSVYNAIDQNQRIKKEGEFDRECERFRSALKGEMEVAVEAIYPLKSLIGVTDNLSQEQFSGFVGEVLKRKEIFESVEWAEVVNNNSLDEFNRSMRIDHEGYETYKYNIYGQKVGVDSRLEYCPLKLIEPYQMNRDLIGYDLFSDKSRRAVLLSAANTGELAISSKVETKRNRKHSSSVLMVLPVFVEDRIGADERALRGLVTATMNLESLFKNVFTIAPSNPEMRVKVYDEASKKLFESSSSQKFGVDLNKKISLQAGNQIWQLYFDGSSQFGEYYLTSFKEWVLILGVVGSILISMFLFFFLSDNRRNLVLMNARLEKELSERQRAEDKLVDIEQFAYIASHDLQEPLRTVNNYIGLLKMELDKSLNETQEKFMTTITDAIVRMQDLIKDLLDYSKIGKEDNKNEIDVEQLLKEVLMDMEMLLKEKKAQVTFNELPAVEGFHSGLKSVFQNLINNGIKFSKADVPSKIHISADINEKETIFAVEDNGIGIDKKFHNKVFVIFHRLHHKTEFPGTGIGLAQCKKIIELHGGRIWLDSDEGKGTTFYFTIPKRKV